MGLNTNRIMNSILAVAIASAAAMAAPKQKPLTVWIMPNGASPQEILEKRLELFTKKTKIPERTNKSNLTIKQKINQIDNRHRMKLKPN